MSLLVGLLMGQVGLSIVHNFLPGIRERVKWSESCVTSVCEREAGWCVHVVVGGWGEGEVEQWRLRPQPRPYDTLTTTNTVPHSILYITIHKHSLVQTLHHHSLTLSTPFHYVTTRLRSPHSLSRTQTQAFKNQHYITMHQHSRH